MIGYNLIASPGRLANQMFKYAALKGISKNMGYEFCIPPSYPFIERNKFIYKASIKLLYKKNKHNHKLFVPFKMESLTRRNIQYLNTNEIIKESSFEFDKTIFNNCPDNINIWGFFQSEKYFLNVRSELLDDFTFKNKIRLKATDSINKFENPVSIHIRRTDYLTNENHSALEINYYEDAISNFSKDQVFLVFTDDIDWVSNQALFNKKNFIIMSKVFNKNKFLDLCAMTLCDSHIIANSSFSWWGAWLSKQKKVIAPKYWFKDSKLEDTNTKDLLPESWFRIEN